MGIYLAGGQNLVCDVKPTVLTLLDSHDQHLTKTKPPHSGDHVVSHFGFSSGTAEQRVLGGGNERMITEVRC